MHYQTHTYTCTNLCAIFRFLHTPVGKIVPALKQQQQIERNTAVLLLTWYISVSNINNCTSADNKYISKLISIEMNTGL